MSSSQQQPSASASASEGVRPISGEIAPGSNTAGDRKEQPMGNFIRRLTYNNKTGKKRFSFFGGVKDTTSAGQDAKTETATSPEAKLDTTTASPVAQPDTTATSPEVREESGVNDTTTSKSAVPTESTHKQGLAAKIEAVARSATHAATNVVKPSATTKGKGPKVVNSGRSEPTTSHKPFEISPHEHRAGVQMVSKLKLYEERAQLLGQRFGLEINVSQWQSTEGKVLRVEKPIRMRVRRTCHLCGQIFGSARECPDCQHSRCSKCIRDPPRRSEAEREASKLRIESRQREIQEQKSQYLAVDYSAAHKKLPPLTRKPRCPKQDLVYKKPRQRVRRTCHECDTLFRGTNKVCRQCSHVRCTDCPREPSKKNNYPYGYPGDAFGPSAVPHHLCHACHDVYPGGSSLGTPCEGCGHRRCRECKRQMPRKVETPHDPEILQRVQETLAALKLAWTS